MIHYTRLAQNLCLGQRARSSPQRELPALALARHPFDSLMHRGLPDTRPSASFVLCPATCTIHPCVQLTDIRLNRVGALGGEAQQGQRTSTDAAECKHRPSARPLIQLNRASHPAMEQHLGLAALRLPSRLEELSGEALFASASSDASQGAPDAAQLTAWLQAARAEAPTALDWRFVHRALVGGRLSGGQPAQLASLLGAAADAAAQQLELELGLQAGGGGRGGATASTVDVAAAGDPRRLQALRNSFKLSLFFLCCLARGEGCANAAAAGAQQEALRKGASAKKAAGGGGGSAAASTLTQQLRARRAALQAIVAIEEALQASRGLLLPAVADARAVGRLARAAALHCLQHPLAAGADRAAKDLSEACFHALAGAWCGVTLVGGCRMPVWC